MLIWSISATDAIPTPMPDAFARISSARVVRTSGSRRFESSTPAISVLGGNITAAAVRHAGFPQQRLEVAHRLHAQVFRALALETLFQRAVELAHALSRVARKPV